MKKKLKSSAGFSLVEMLCAAVILMLLCLMISTGIHMAMVNYRAITSESEVQLLLSSLSDALADKLRYCVVYTDETGTAVKGLSIGEVSAPDGMVLVDSSKLLPDGAYGEKLAEGANGRKYRAEVTVEPSVSSGTPIFTVELKVGETSGDIGAETKLTIRCLNPPKKEGTE